MDAVTGCPLPIEMIMTFDMWPLTLFGPVPHVSAPCGCHILLHSSQQVLVKWRMGLSLPLCPEVQRGSSWHEWSRNSPRKGMVGLEPRQGSYKTPGSYEQGRCLTKSLEAAEKRNVP